MARPLTLYKYAVEHTTHYMRCHPRTVIFANCYSTWSTYRAARDAFWPAPRRSRCSCCPLFVSPPQYCKRFPIPTLLPQWIKLYVILARSTYRPTARAATIIFYACFITSRIACRSYCQTACMLYVLHAASWKCRTQIAKNSPSGHHRTTLSGYILATKARIDNWKKMFQWLSHMSSQYGKLRPNRLRSVGEFGAHQHISTGFASWLQAAALLHGTLVVGIRQTSRRWTEGATYTQQGGHHVGYWPTF